MLAFKVDPSQLARALAVDADGHLRFGTARSVEQARGLEAGVEVLFGDYLMEGNVTYGLRLNVCDGVAWLEVVPHGTDRDRYLPPHLRWQLSSAGVEVVAEREGPDLQRGR